MADKYTRNATLTDKDTRAAPSTDNAPRLTLTTMKVLSVFCEDPKAEMSGREIGKKTKLASGTVYPILIRLERVGWLESRWEDIDPRTEGRPRRRFYKIKALGYQKTQDALREMNQSFGVASWIS